MSNHSTNNKIKHLELIKLIAGCFAAAVVCFLIAVGINGLPVYSGRSLRVSVAVLFESAFSKPTGLIVGAMLFLIFATLAISIYIRHRNIDKER